MASVNFRLRLGCQVQTMTGWLTWHLRVWCRAEERFSITLYWFWSRFVTVRNWSWSKQRQKAHALNDCSVCLSTCVRTCVDHDNHRFCTRSGNSHQESSKTIYVGVNWVIFKSKSPDSSRDTQTWTYFVTEANWLPRPNSNQMMIHWGFFVWRPEAKSKNLIGIVTSLVTTDLWLTHIPLHLINGRADLESHLGSFFFYMKHKHVTGLQNRSALRPRKLPRVSLVLSPPFVKDTPWDSFAKPDLAN